METRRATNVWMMLAEVAFTFNNRLSCELASDAPSEPIARWSYWGVCSALLRRSTTEWLRRFCVCTFRLSRLIHETKGDDKCFGGYHEGNASTWRYQSFPWRFASDDCRSNLGNIQAICRNRTLELLVRDQICSQSDGMISLDCIVAVVAYILVYIACISVHRDDIEIVSHGKMSDLIQQILL